MNRLLSRLGLPALAATIALAVLLLAPPLAARAGVNDLDAEEHDVAVLLNQERVSRGLSTLQLSPTLQASAEWMANDLAVRGYLDHTDSLGRSFAVRVAGFGYPTPPAYARENIAYGYNTADEVMAGWMNSSGHRANNLAENNAAMGVARVRSQVDGYWYWALVLGSVADAGSVSVEGSTPTPVPTGTPPVGTGPNTFASAFPSTGLGLNVWNGGSVGQLVAGANQGGARAVFVTAGGELVGYVIGAPSFVNAGFEAAFPSGEVPGGTPVLVVMR